MTPQGEVQSRLDPSIDSTVSGLILGALESQESLQAVLSGALPEEADRADVDGASGADGSVYLQALSVTGFRGIGDEAKLELAPGPGLTAVVGRNGSGKSSFSDALEVLLTGDSYRWSGKAKEWKDGWRNLHSAGDARITATFRTEGVSGPTTLERRWDGSDGLDDVPTTAQHHGQKLTDLVGLGWVEPMRLYRPLLSYSELGALVASPSSLFDALSGVLGIDEFVEATKRLADARLELQRVDKDATKELKETLLPALEELDDDRARVAHAALSPRTWDLNTAASVIATRSEDQRGLEALTRLAVPPAGEVEAVASELRRATEAVGRLQQSDSQRARRLIGLLERALDHHIHDGDGDCPVCGSGRLDDAWRQATETQIDELSEHAAAYDGAVTAQRSAIAAAETMSRSPTIRQVEGIDVATVTSAWREWGTFPENPSHAADHLVERHHQLADAVNGVVAEAKARYSETEQRWTPVASRLASWLDDAREALAGRESVKALSAAEAALKRIIAEIRSDRFAPIESKALELWNVLRLQSNVDLESVELSGSGTRRRVDLNVTVDGQETAALGVVSQGEINCLALSLFFPRATLPQSPFRFLVIDDPVQAMDPARVDGLARVFSQIAGDRQVMVFTHDDRLPEALRRLGLPHTVKSVTRRAGSHVEVRDSLDPVNQYFQDAWALAADDDLLDGVVSRAAPGICRLGLEAACIEAVRRRRIEKGDSHRSVEVAIAEARTLNQFAALALFDDASQGGRVLGEINRKFGTNYADAFRDVNTGAHRAFTGSLKDLINDARGLATRLRTV